MSTSSPGDTPKVITTEYTKVSIEQETGGVFTRCTLPDISVANNQLAYFGRDGKGQQVSTASTLSYTDIELHRGVTESTAFHDWHQKVTQEGVEGNTKDITIELCDNQGNTVRTWSLVEAYPVTYHGGDASADQPTIHTEGVTLTYKEAKIVT